MEQSNMTIVRLAHQGFCYGVHRSIQILNQALKENLPQPIYLLGNLVHNIHIQNYFSSKDIIILNGNNRLEMIEEIAAGTVIFTAHGVSDIVKQKAVQKGLYTIDATCPYVEKTYKQMSEAVQCGYQLLYIGKDKHPETEAVLDLSQNVYVLTEPLELDIIPTLKPLALAHQTTMSNYDVEAIYLKLQAYFPSIKILDMICLATQTRQDELTSAIQAIPPSNQALIIVIGDRSSNNSTKLMERAKSLNRGAVWFVSSIVDVNLQEIRKFDYIIIASGTSTPLAVVDEIEQVLQNIDKISEEYVSTHLQLEDYILK